jgi:hypothetical protein
MKLSEVFELLQYGELASISISGGIDEVKGIRVEDYPTLISHINLALTDLHTKFNLKERELVIQQYDNITIYHMQSDYAVSNTSSTQPVKYIVDTEEDKFNDDILRVNAIFDEAGCELPINDENRANSLFLNGYSSLQIPFPSSENSVFIMYRANHEKLNVQLPDLEAEINIPAYCVEALLSYVTSRVHCQRTTQEAQANAVSYMAKYNNLCDQIEERNNLHNNPSNSNFKLGENGWV